MKISVDPGIIEFTQIHVTHVSANMIRLYADCVQKYAEVLGYHQDDENLVIQVWANEHTLKVTNKLADPTSIIISGLDHTWECFTELGRYILDIVLVRKHLPTSREDLEALEKFSWYPNED